MALSFSHSHPLLLRSSTTSTSALSIVLRRSCCTCSDKNSPTASAPPARRQHRRPRKIAVNTISPDNPRVVEHACVDHKLFAARSELRCRTGTDLPLQDQINSPANTDTPIPTELPVREPIFDARNKITVKWLWLVSAIAHKLYRTYSQSFPEMRAAICPADLVQEGVCGLINAVEKWDSNKGCPFDAYAFYTIKYSIIRAVQNQSRPIRLPVHVLDKLAKMRKVRQNLELANRKVTVDAIARGAGVSSQAAQLYLDRSKSTMSIDAPLSNPTVTGASSQRSQTTPLRDFLVDHSVDVAREVERSCTREAVAHLVNSSDLLELERSVLFLKYGLDDGIERVRAEVSRILDVRVTNVRRAELSALKKLRHFIGDDASSWTDLIS